MGENGLHLILEDRPANKHERSLAEQEIMDCD